LGFEAGADGYLTRPVEPPVLIATVRTLLFARHADLIRRGLDAKLRTLFNLAPVAIAILDDNLRYESVNPAYCALTGYSSEELLGQPVKTLASSDAPPPGETPATYHSAFKRKDGGLVHIGYQIVKEGISGVRILVATARTEAEGSNRLQVELLATISHELRNPLNAILGWASVLSRKPDLPAPVMHGLQAIERNSRLQAQLISDLLDYAGITFGNVRLATEIIDPYPVVRAALEAVNVSAQSTGTTIRASFDEEPLRIEADAARLQQVVWNLLSNAVKFSPKGSEVQLAAGRSGDSFSLVVSDNGIGIEADFLPRIFERFSQQHDTTTRSHRGSGLGMAIVKQLAELHGGSIHASSAGKGLGAKFTLKIPLRPPSR